MRGDNRFVGTVGFLTASLVALWVQLEGYKEMPYRDIAGVPTVCSGHTGPDVVMGQKWTKAQCEEVTIKDLTKFGLVVLRCVDVPLTRHQFEALVVFAGNVGEFAFCESRLARRLNEGKFEEAQKEFERWIWAGGKPVLISRRAAELAHFKKPDDPIYAITSPFTVTDTNQAALRALGLM